MRLGEGVCPCMLAVAESPATSLHTHCYSMLPCPEDRRRIPPLSASRLDGLVDLDARDVALAKANRTLSMLPPQVARATCSRLRLGQAPLFLLRHDFHQRQRLPIPSRPSCAHAAHIHTSWPIEKARVCCVALKRRRRGLVQRRFVLSSVGWETTPPYGVVGSLLPSVHDAFTVPFRQRTTIVSPGRTLGYRHGCTS
jgi:hypothetical protein